MSVARIPYRAFLRAGLISSHWKGLLLSHLLGIVLASEFFVGRAAAAGSVPYAKFPLFTDWLDLPLRLIALWLILDRNWRVGRLRIQIWDVLALSFPLLVGLAYPLTAQDPSIAADFESYRSFLGDVLRAYTVYLLVREGYNRAGFRGDIVIRYVLGVLALSALFAVAQALDIGSARAWTIRFYALRDSVEAAEQSYRARGFAPHWNGFAAEMVFASIFVTAPLNWRRLRWWEYGLTGVYLVGLLVSTSRGGYVTYAAVFLAAAVFFLYTRRYKTGLAILGLIVAGVAVFTAIIFTANLRFFKDVISPPKVRSAAFGSFDYRMEQARRLIEVGKDHPIAGTGPSQLMYESPHVDYYSASSVSGIRDVSYAVIFAQFGILGMAYIVGVIYSLARFVSRRRAVHPYAALAFLTGVAFGIDMLVEVIFVGQPMILVSIGAALAYSRVSSYSKELAQREFSPIVRRSAYATS
jgi:hypothetical protein